MSVKVENFIYAGKREVCGKNEAYMIRTEDKAGVKEYLKLLDEQGLNVRKTATVYVFREIDCARRYLEMVFEDLDRIQDRTGNLKDGIGKNYATDAIAAAREKMDEVREWADRVDALVEKGTRDSVARFQHGRVGALERPFPLIKVEEELKTIMDCLVGVFAAVDIGIGRIEETEGMACRDGHYVDLTDGALWEGGAGDQAWLSVLWPMRSMEKNIISAQSALYETARRVDGMRPKAHSIIKMYPLVPGFQWELEKKRERAAAPASGRNLYKTGDVWGLERMEGQTDILCVAENVMQLKAEDDSGQKKGHGKPSLRKRLEMAGEKSHQMNDRGSLQERKSKIGERQR